MAPDRRTPGVPRNSAGVHEWDRYDNYETGGEESAADDVESARTAAHRWPVSIHRAALAANRFVLEDATTFTFTGQTDCLTGVRLTGTVVRRAGVRSDVAKYLDVRGRGKSLAVRGRLYRYKAFLRGDLARKAFEDGPASALGMSVEEASMGAVQILTHSMVQSIEENSVRKGFDPRDFALVAEGGAGPLFAVPIAVEVGTPHVVVPPHPGIAAAMGLVATDMVYEYAATTYQRLSKLDVESLQSRFEELEAQAAAQLEEDGIEADRIVATVARGTTAASYVATRN